MTSAAEPGTSRLRLELGRVTRVQVQVGYRDVPGRPPQEHYLLDLALPEPLDPRSTFDERPYLDALEPVVYLGADVPRHYSLHVHRWHTSWGVSTSAVEVGVTVTTGPREPGVQATYDATVAAFRALLDLAGGPAAELGSRDEAVTRARRAVAAAYGQDADALALTSEEHHPDEGAWSVGLRATADDRYAVLVGVVDGCARSVRVRHEPVREVIDSLGTE
jgi:hypothetical protein